MIRTECRASASERQWTARREEGSRWSRFRRSRHVARMFRTMSREWSRASRWPKRQGAGALHRHALRPLGPPPLEPRAVVHDVPPPNRFEASLRNTARQRSSPIRYAPRSGGCARADVLSSRPALGLRPSSRWRAAFAPTCGLATRIRSVYRERGSTARGSNESLGFVRIFRMCTPSRNVSGAPRRRSSRAPSRCTDTGPGHRART